MAVTARTTDDGHMELISPPRPVDRLSVAPAIAGILFGTLLMVAGIILGYVAYATPFLSWLAPTGRLGPSEMITGAIVWTIALVAPAGFLLLGTSRLARILAAARRRIPRRSPLQAALADLPEDVALASGLTLPDGRGISDILVGPFGAAVVRELPSPHVTRVRNGHWEARASRGWIPLENPLDRATRDAERVRRWLGHEDADFVVKTYAAVLGPPTTTVERTATCAVLTRDQLAAWVLALPAQRSLTPGRRDRMLDAVRRAAG
jgi:hypothetical protein